MILFWIFLCFLDNRPPFLIAFSISMAESFEFWTHSTPYTQQFALELHHCNNGFARYSLSSSPPRRTRPSPQPRVISLFFFSLLDSICWLGYDMWSHFSGLGFIVHFVTGNLTEINHLLGQMVRFITVMMDWHHTPMSQFTLLDFSAGELRHFLLEILVKELLPSVSVALLVLGISIFRFSFVFPNSFCSTF